MSACFYQSASPAVVWKSHTCGAVYRWQLTSSEGACSEGLVDLRGSWDSQTTIDERPGYTLVQASR